ncbi:ArsR family transcriptional regulator [Lysinibacillus capsici]|uniref:ArsR family transcriptional regulator n=1 Tax=Lysinibacillus capsici TaxID=2115968 RepID=UPI002A8401DA|nr:ArsR family transcriptional regulator [Lysinibacillus capsici]
MTEAAIKYDIFQAIADPTRRSVLQLLAASDRPISNITEHFTISRTAVVKHLKIYCKIFFQFSVNYHM